MTVFARAGQQPDQQRGARVASPPAPSVARCLALAKVLLLISAASGKAPQQSFVFIGSEASVASSPKPAGFAAVALPIGQQSWSYSMYNLYFAAGKPVTVTSTGLAKEMWCKTLGSVAACVLALGTVGAATTNSATTASFNVGGGVNLRGLFKPWPSISLFLGGMQTKAGSTSPALAILAIGRSF